jgi:signal transduction histidine kinase
MKVTLVRGWMALTAVLVAVHAVLSFSLQKGDTLTVFGDVTQCVMLLAVVLALGSNAMSNRGGTRVFWLFMTGGAGLWLATQLLWTYYELYLGHKTPNPFVGDVIIFLHIVPMIGALALRPHRYGDRPLRLGLLDFLLLLLWWLFLYLFIVIPWQYVHYDEGLYGFNFNALYDAEKFAFLVGLGVFWLRSSGVWKWIYAHLFTAAAVYEISSHNINIAIDRGAYYTGGPLDVSLLLAMAWFAGAALVARQHLSAPALAAMPSQKQLSARSAMAAVLSIPGFMLWGLFVTDATLYGEVLLLLAVVWLVGGGLILFARPPSSTPEAAVEPPHEVWPSRLAMAAVLSIPGFVLWDVFFSDAPPLVRNFRLLVAVGAMVLLTFLVFLKQHILDRELLRLLRASEESLQHQKDLQSELIRSEKLASMGRLVAGAAHEINNPLTAILGYADLLETDPSLPEAQRTLAGKVRQQARRTHELVNNLVRFAKRAPGEKARISVGPVLASAIKMRQSELSQKMIFLEAQTKLSLPDVWADEHQLMTIFLHLINNAAEAMAGEGGGMLTVRSREEEDKVVLEFSDTGPGVKDPQHVFDPFYTTKPVGKGTGLGLSAVYGIVQEHGGNIECFNRAEGGATFVLKLPVAAENGQKPAETPAPAAPSR